MRPMTAAAAVAGSCGIRAQAHATGREVSHPPCERGIGEPADPTPPGATDRSAGLQKGYVFKAVEDAAASPEYDWGPVAIDYDADSAGLQKARAAALCRFVENGRTAAGGGGSVSAQASRRAGESTGPELGGVSGAQEAKKRERIGAAAREEGAEGKGGHHRYLRTRRPCCGRRSRLWCTPPTRSPRCSTMPRSG